MSKIRFLLTSLAVLLLGTNFGFAQILDKQKLLDAQTFWDNRDWDWYKSNIPFFECPDPDIKTTYYYRWELVTKHLTYGSPNSGYSFTEFIDRPFWSGAYGVDQLPGRASALRGPLAARSSLRPGLRPLLVPHARVPSRAATAPGLPTQSGRSILSTPTTPRSRTCCPTWRGTIEGWEKEHFDSAVGLFWQTGHDDGMEFNINSRQTRDIVRGAPGYRPTLNSYLWADALAIAELCGIGRRKADRRNVSRQSGQSQGEPSKRNSGTRSGSSSSPWPSTTKNKTERRSRRMSLTYQTGKIRRRRPRPRGDRLRPLAVQPARLRASSRPGSF